MAKQLLPAEKGIRTFFGKRYLWLLDHEGRLGLHSLDRVNLKDQDDDQ